jgi:group II intron reverse transcriptase/maturase
VYEAWKRVKAKGGGPGIDGQTIEGFEKDLEDNLYKIWNRMSSGSYFPPAVRKCEIPKEDGKKRVLGIPTVSDRVAQSVATMKLEPEVEPHFHEDSYGYRPRKSAKEAVGKARERCWRHDWVIDLDIQSFFDTIDARKRLELVGKHTEERWILLYVERWLKAPMETADGKREPRERGTPQGGVISPLLANIYLHHAFDAWMRAEFERLPFERYADDIIVHCVTEKQAWYVLGRIRQRLEEWGLALHPEKTKIVYCKDGNRTEDYPHTKFTFLGYEFRPRMVRNEREGNIFVGFTPAVSPKARKSIRQTIRSWRLGVKTPMTLEAIAEMVNPVVRGWINYYGKYHRSALRPVLRQLDYCLAKWAMRKYKRRHRRLVHTLKWLDQIAREKPIMAHWQWRLNAA